MYEISDPEHGDLVGIPEDYLEYVRAWLGYEMADANYRQMLDTLDVFDRRAVLIEASDTFGIDKKNYGKNENRRANLIESGVYPSDLFRAVVSKDELKEIVDRYRIDAHKRKTDDMIRQTIRYFEESQKDVEDDESQVDVYLSAYEAIADGEIQAVPPQLQDVTDDEDLSRRLDVLFEDATTRIFADVFNLEGTTRLGQQTSGIAADGEIEQDGKWLLWDNKRRLGEFTLDANTRAKIKNYIDQKRQQHDVEWFLIIAPAFSDTAIQNAKKLEMEVGVDIRLVTAAVLTDIGTAWRDDYADEDRELPLSVFYGTGILEPGIVKSMLETQFA